MRTSHPNSEARTFHSGSYLHELFVGGKPVAYNAADVCARIKAARERAGFTQEDAADIIGVGLRAYQYYEDDRVPFKRLPQIASVFRVSEGWLLHGEATAHGSGGSEMEELRSEVSEMRQMLDRIEQLLQDRPQTAGGSA